MLWTSSSFRAVVLILAQGITIWLSFRSLIGTTRWVSWPFWDWQALRNGANEMENIFKIVYDHAKESRCNNRPYEYSDTHSIELKMQTGRRERILNPPPEINWFIYMQEMKRVLFIFAKLNQGLRYVQGMNELLAPIYYQFRNDIHLEQRQHAEADSFYCFMDIIAEFRDHFCQQLVSSRSLLM